VTRILAKASAGWWLALLAAGAFSLATVLQPRATTWSPRAGADSLLKVLLGDGRKLFADFFFRKADVYFHAGYYPSIFDQANQPKDSRHMTEGGHEEHAEPEGAGESHEGHEHAAHETAGSAEEQHMKDMAFLKEPRDWIERFGRHFVVTDHTHLEGGGEREILPWLRVTAELDPQKIETYTVASFWLRTRLGKFREAEEFLREGLKANPNSYEILFELGQVYNQNFKEPERARNVMELALRRWTEQASAGKKPDEFVLEQISVNLAKIEEDAGNLPQAIKYLEIAKRVTPDPAVVQRGIDELKARSKPGSGK
jgi:tetratricopeptide (TPR) repeat protein